MTASADAYRKRPARGSALADQLQAAEMHASDLLLSDCLHLGVRGTEPPFNAQQGTGPVRKVADRFRRTDEAAEMTWCRHLKPDSPQPAVWQAWRPSRLYCASCVAHLPPLSGKDDRRCDGCRWVGTKIWPHRMMMPGRSLPARSGKPEEARPPVMLMFGLCGRCQAKAKAAAAEVAAATPCKLRIPPAGRPVTAAEATDFRTALMLARAIGEGDKEKAADLPAKADLLQLLWATVMLVIVLTTESLHQAEWAPDAVPPEPAELWDMFPATLARWDSYGPAAGLSSKKLQDYCNTAVKLIKQVHRGDDYAFTQFTTREAAIPALAGAEWILAAITQWPVQAGLAATADQVWAEMLGAIGRWESSTAS
jgi:hypothetical protein